MGRSRLFKGEIETSVKARHRAAQKYVLFTKTWIFFARKCGCGCPLAPGAGGNTMGTTVVRINVAT